MTIRTIENFPVAGRFVMDWFRAMRLGTELAVAEQGWLDMEVERALEMAGHGEMARRRVMRAFYEQQARD